MMECRICGRRWKDPHFRSRETSYTFCDQCADRVLEQMRSGQTVRGSKVVKE